MKIWTVLLSSAVIAVSSACADLIITMVADGDLTSRPRFVEVFNNSDSSIDLADYKLAQYANGSTDGSASTLSGMLGANSFAYLVSNGSSDANRIQFEACYGSSMTIVEAAQASSNGDDVYALRDAAGDILDVFGVVGVVGSGQNWEFADGLMRRANSITTAHTTFDYATPGAGASGASLTGWSFTDLHGVAEGDYETTAPIGTFVAVPEPTTFAFLAMGMSALFVARRKMRKA